MERSRGLITVLAVCAILLTSAGVLHASASAGHCYYDNARVGFLYEGANITPSELFAAVSGWSGTTYALSSNSTERMAIDLQFSYAGMTGHGDVDLIPPAGGPRSTVQVVLYASSMRPRPYNPFSDPFGPTVDETFASDRARLEPGVQELQTALGGPPTYGEVWEPTGMC